MNLYIGTSGWSYTHWRKIFYPEDLSSNKYLEFYQTIFPVVELNASFYRLPQAEVVTGWRKRTPPGFLFCPKLSRYITHIKKLHDVESPLAEFIKRIKHFKKKLGPILIQLPPSLVFHPERVAPFFKLLRRYRSLQFVLEARHPSWTEKEALDFLAFYKVGWVIADSGSKYPTVKIATSNVVYFRFHGRQSLYRSGYTKRELRPFVKYAKEALKTGKEVFVFFNNDDKGHAVKDALTFQNMIKEKK